MLDGFRGTDHRGQLPASGWRTDLLQSGRCRPARFHPFGDDCGRVSRLVAAAVPVAFVMQAGRASFSGWQLHQGEAASRGCAGNSQTRQLESEEFSRGAIDTRTRKIFLSRMLALRLWHNWLN